MAALSHETNSVGYDTHTDGNASLTLAESLTYDRLGEQPDVEERDLRELPFSEPLDAIEPLKIVEAQDPSRSDLALLAVVTMSEGDKVVQVWAPFKDGKLLGTEVAVTNEGFDPTQPRLGDGIGMKPGVTLELGRRNEAIKGVFGELPKTISGRHAGFNISMEGVLSVVDEGSRNGTKILFKRAPQAEAIVDVSSDSIERRLNGEDDPEGLGDFFEEDAIPEDKEEYPQQKPEFRVSQSDVARLGSLHAQMLDKAGYMPPEGSPEVIQLAEGTIGEFSERNAESAIVLAALMTAGAESEDMRVVQYMLDTIQRTGRFDQDDFSRLSDIVTVISHIAVGMRNGGESTERITESSSIYLQNTLDHLDRGVSAEDTKKKDALRACLFAYGSGVALRMPEYSYAQFRDMEQTLESIR